MHGLHAAPSSTFPSCAPTPAPTVRFEVEDGEPLAYCYEVQLEEKAQRRGLGKHMMQLLELMVGG